MNVLHSIRKYQINKTVFHLLMTQVKTRNNLKSAQNRLSTKVHEYLFIKAPLFKPSKFNKKKT